jgi:septation ring formation regulator EzrA
MGFEKGNKLSKGRPTKADEEKSNEIFLKAIKEVYSTDNDTEAKVAFTKDLLESQRGQIFVAEHLFGKPKDKVEATLNVNDFNIKDIVKFKD